MAEFVPGWGGGGGEENQNKRYWFLTWLYSLTLQADCEFLWLPADCKVHRISRNDITCTHISSFKGKEKVRCHFSPNRTGCDKRVVEQRSHPTAWLLKRSKSCQVSGVQLNKTHITVWTWSMPYTHETGTRGTRHNYSLTLVHARNFTFKLILNFQCDIQNDGFLCFLLVLRFSLYVAHTAETESVWSQNGISDKGMNTAE
jgi:hypothetical protein